METLQEAKLEDLIPLPYDNVRKAYERRISLLREAEESFLNKKKDQLPRLQALLHSFVREEDPSDISQISSLMQSLIIDSTGFGSAQSRYASRIKQNLEDTIGLEELHVYTRKDIATRLRRLYEDINPNFVLSTNAFVVDLGLKNTAAAFSIESSAMGVDIDGKAIPGVLLMCGYSILDLVDNSDFIGDVGLSCKQEVLTPLENAKFRPYLISKLTLSDQEKAVIDDMMEMYRPGETEFNAKLLMKAIGNVVSRQFSSFDYNDLQTLNLKGDDPDAQQKKDKIFHDTYDQGLSIGGTVLVASAYAIRLTLQKNGEELPDMPNNPDYNLSWGGNFLRFVYGNEATERPDFQQRAKAMDTYFQLIRTHGPGNASTFAVRAAASAYTDLPGALNSGINVLSGDRHGFAAVLSYQQVSQAYDRLREQHGHISRHFIAEEVARIYREEGVFQGFGHPVYKRPRERTPPGDPRFGIMREIIQSWGDSEIQRKMQFYNEWDNQVGDFTKREKGSSAGFPANVDLLTPILLQDRIGLPPEANPLMFYCGREFGHVLHYIEAIQFPLIRSRGLYEGPRAREIKPVNNF
ncbi:citrate/2-methylcitrate synthase [Nanoarchaeota archaeon]